MKVCGGGGKKRRSHFIWFGFFLLLLLPSHVNVSDHQIWFIYIYTTKTTCENTRKQFLNDDYIKTAACKLNKQSGGGGGVHKFVKIIYEMDNL